MACQLATPADAAVIDCLASDATVAMDDLGLDREMAAHVVTSESDFVDDNKRAMTARQVERVLEANGW